MANFHNKSVNAHQFSMIPRADIPRSRFNVQTSHKTTFDAGKLIPIYVDEVLPGDTFSLSCTAFGRMATPIFPIMDNLHMDRSEEHTSELQSPLIISYAVFCL